MRKVFITGVTSGIGKALAERLLKNNIKVVGVARREKILKEIKHQYPNFYYVSADLSAKDSWKKIVRNLKQKNFIPEIFILNAAVSENDLTDGIKPETTRRIFEINFFSAMEGISRFFPLLKRNSQVIAISSLSSFKGNANEGIGYAASKSALSIAFESLYQKFKNKGIKFKIVFFGPVATGMNPFFKRSVFTISRMSALNTIIKAIENGNVFYYNPGVMFFIIKAVKILPERIYFSLLDYIGHTPRRN